MASAHLLELYRSFLFFSGQHSHDKEGDLEMKLDELGVFQLIRSNTM